MSARNGSAYDIEIQTADLAWLGLNLDLPDSAAAGADRIIQGLLEAASSDDPLAVKPNEEIQEDFSGGIGIDYDVAPGVDTRFPGYAISAGAATAVQVPINTHSSSTKLVAFAEFGGNLYIAQEGSSTAGRYGRVLVLTGGTGTASEAMVIGTTAGAPLVGSSYFIRDMLVADDGSGNTRLFVSASDANGLNGVLYKFDGAAWTNSSTNAGANGRNRLAKVSWTTTDGNTAWRLVAISGPKTVSYTVPNGDPMGLSATNWVEGVRIDTSGNLLEIVAFRRHAYFAASDDVYDLNEVGESSALTSYLQKMLTTVTTFAVEHLNGYVYATVGRSLIRLYVGDQGALNESPIEGHCAPGWNTRSESCPRGYGTAMTVDQGYLVYALYDPTAQKSYIFYGIDRRIVGKDSPNPLIWHGPLVHTSVDYRINRLWTSALAGDLRLWMASQSVGGATPRLDWVSIPNVGSPIQDLAVGGSHRFAPGNSPSDIFQPFCRLETLQNSHGNKANNFIFWQHDIGSRGLSRQTQSDGSVVDDGLGTKLTLNGRADPPPGSTTYGVLGDSTTGPTQTLTPPVGTVLAGHKTQLRLDVISPSGTATPPKVAVLDSIRTLGWQVAPSSRALTLPIMYGDTGREEDRDPKRDPDTITTALRTLGEGTKTVLRDRRGKTWTFKVRQVHAYTSHQHDGGDWGETVHAQIVGDILAGPL
jgi:hypothetical protein